MNPVSENTRRERETWIKAIQEAIACGVPAQLRRRLQSTIRRIEKSMRYGGKQGLQAKVQQLQAQLVSEKLGVHEAEARQALRDGLEPGQGRLQITVLWKSGTSAVDATITLDQYQRLLACLDIPDEHGGGTPE